MIRKWFRERQQSKAESTIKKESSFNGGNDDEDNTNNQNVNGDNDGDADISDPM
jgi:hypothetical protein